MTLKHMNIDEPSTKKEKLIAELFYLLSGATCVFMDANFQDRLVTIENFDIIRIASLAYVGRILMEIFGPIDDEKLKKELIKSCRQLFDRYMKDIEEMRCYQKNKDSH
jgi:hypothetical protein